MQPQDLINATTLSQILEDSHHLECLARSLAAFLESQRWFAAKNEGIQSVEVLDSVEIPGEQTSNGHATFELLLATVVTNGGSTDCYAVPTTCVVDTSTDQDAENAKGPTIATLTSNEASAGSTNRIVECSGDPEFWRAITTNLAEHSLTTRNGRVLKFSRTASSKLSTSDVFRNADFRIHGGEQSNSAVAISDQHFLKLFRRPRIGHNPDAEVGIFLTDRTEFKNSPQVEATIDISGADGNRCLALISEQVTAKADAWTYTLNHLQNYWERLANLGDRPEFPPGLGIVPRTDSTLGEIKVLVEELMAPFHAEVVQLGRRTAELHTALSRCDDDPSFAPALMTPDLLSNQIVQIRNEVQRTCKLLERSASGCEFDADLPAEIWKRANKRLDEMSSFDVVSSGIVNIRCHGDYHLGQVLRTKSDFIIIDFEGEPDRPFEERREKRCAMKDVAGMIRSLHYASCTTAVGMLPPPDQTIMNPKHWQRFWYENAAAAFSVAYKETAEGQAFLPADWAAFNKLLDLFLIEKVLYELRYEINNRPDWVKIPLAGLNAVLGLTE